MSRTIKSCYKYLTSNVGDLNISVGLSFEESELLIEIPLCQYLKEKSFKDSFIYRPFGNYNYGFGNQVMLNNQRIIESVENDYKITLPDNSEVMLYYSDEGIYMSDDGTYTLLISGEENILGDKYGNYYKFESLADKMPSSLTLVNNNKLSFTKQSNGYLTQINDDIVNYSFINNSNQSSITHYYYRKRNKVYSSVTLGYANNVLSSVIYKNKNQQTIGNYTFAYGLNPQTNNKYIKIKDNITGYSETYEYQEDNEKKIIKLIKTNKKDGDSDYEIATTLENSSFNECNVVEASMYNGRKEKYYFDNLGRHIQTSTREKEVLTVGYDMLNYVTKVTRPFSFKDNDYQLLNGGSSTLTSKGGYEGAFKDLFTTYYESTASNQYIMRTSNEKLQANQTISFGFFARGVSGTRLKAIITTNETIEKEIELTSEFKFYAIDIKVKALINNITFKLTCEADATWATTTVYAFIMHTNQDYIYDQRYNLVGVEDENVKVYQFDENNFVINKQDKRSGISRYVNNSQGRVIKTVDHNLDTTIYGYNSAGAVISVEKNISGKLFRETATYNDMLQPLTQTDVNGNRLTYVYDEEFDLVSIEDSLGNKKTYFKNTRSLPSQIKMSNGTNESSVHFEYLNDMLDNIRNLNQYYHFVYELDKNIKEVGFGELQDLQQLASYAYEKHFDKYPGLVDGSIELGVEKEYCYDSLAEEIDSVITEDSEINIQREEGLLKSESNEEAEILYGYNKTKEVSSVSINPANESNQITNFDSYENGMMEKTYIDGEDVLCLYESRDRRDLYKNNDFIRKLKISNYYSCYLNEAENQNISCDLKRAGENDIEELNNASSGGNIDTIRCSYNMSSQAVPLVYKTKHFNYSNFNLFVGASFYISDRYLNANKTLFSIRLGTNAYIEVKFSAKALKLSIVGSENEIGSITTQDFNLYEFNTFGINIYIENGRLYYNLFLNESKYSYSTGLWFSSIASLLQYKISLGARLSNTNFTELGTEMTGKIGGIVLGEKASDDFVLSLAENSNAILNALNELADDMVTSDSRVIYYGDVLGVIPGGTLFPLNGSFKSFGGELPKQCDFGHLESEEMLFTYDDLLNRYKYNISLGNISFSVDESSGTIISKSDLSEYNTIYSLGEDVILYVDSTRQLVLSVGGTDHNLGIYYNGGSTNIVSLGYTKNVLSESGRQNDVYTFRVWCDFENILATVTHTGSLSIGDLLIGKATSNHEASKGTVEMLYFNDSFLSNATIASIASKMGQTTKEKKFSADGRLLNECLKIDETVINNKNYTYATYPLNGNTYQTNMVSQVSDSINNPTEYYFDSRGNLIVESSIVEAPLSTVVLKNITYSYDYLNRLTKRVNQLTGETYEYLYDQNGNVIEKRYTPQTGQAVQTTTFAINDRFPMNTIQSVNKNGQTSLFTYNLNGLLNKVTSTINGVTYEKTYTFNQYGLSNYTDTYKNITINFKYDSRGRRVKKIVGTKVYLYYYNGNKLVTEFIDTERVDYLYDESGTLYGFKYNDEIYFYDRDILGQINGIYCKDRTKVVEYTYSPYGEVLSITGSGASTLGVLNHMLYKGYYYDEETGLFYCNSRYYNPEWCRWISPDDIEYLDPQSINGLNLYCYCMNNPISYADPSGHSVILAMLIGVGIGAIVGAGVGQASNTSDKLGIAGWKKFWNSVSGIFVGDFLVSLNNWGKISQTIIMDGKYNFKFDQNPFYSFWNAPLYAMYLKNNQYKDEDSRTTLGLYLELQAHYLFYLIGNDHALDGADMGPTDVDSTGKLFELLASAFRNTIKGVPPKMWWPNI